MGRVSRYKKIKSCDPFYKGPRKEPTRLDNLAPDDEDDQPVPKSVIRLMNSVPCKKGSKPATGVSNKDSIKVHHSEKPKSAQSLDKEEPEFQRRKGEGLKEYLDRMDVESNARIMDAFRKSRRVSDRRKRYLEERKQKFKKRKKPETYLDFSDLKDDVHFREVVTAPPKLSSKPRGAQKISREESKGLLLKEKLTGSDDGKPRVLGLKRKRDLEIERDRVIEQYRQLKKTKVSRTSDKN